MLPLVALFPVDRTLCCQCQQAGVALTPTRSRHRRPRPLRIFLVWIPALIGVCVIMLESTPTFGANHTSGPLRVFWQALFGPVSDVRWETIHHVIRKTGHFAGYGTLSLLFYRAWYRTAEIIHRRTYRIENVIYSLACTLAVAGADEYHQHFLPNRTGTPQDVVLDLVGACTLQLIFWLTMLIVGIARNQPGGEIV